MKSLLRFEVLFPTAGGIAFAGMAYFLAASFGVVPVPGPVEPLAAAIVSDMKARPETWTGDRYTVTNGDVCVWVSNEVSGLGVAKGKRCWPRDGELSWASRSAVYMTANREILPRLRQENLDSINAKLSNR